MLTCVGLVPAIANEQPDSDGRRHGTDTQSQAGPSSAGKEECTGGDAQGRTSDRASERCEGSQHRGDAQVS